MWIFYYDVSSGMSHAPLDPFLVGGIALGMIMFTVFYYRTTKEKSK